jgi:ribosomal protein S18 acetylase RimI-like enzyme
MDVEELVSADEPVVVALWEVAGLTRPWNDPVRDFRRALTSARSTVLGMRLEGQLVGTVMVGDDGHRGWLYYLAVAESWRRTGVGSVLVSAGEAWLVARGVEKTMLMVRTENTGVIDFYEALGFQRDDVVVLGRRVST